jgi:threonine dehydrogenase-like Zn-dependent dehydrogenase
MDLLSLGMVRLEPLVTEVAPLADWQRVFADTAAARGIKYLLDPRAGR